MKQVRGPLTSTFRRVLSCAALSLKIPQVAPYRRSSATQWTTGAAYRPAAFAGSEGPDQAGVGGLRRG